MDGTLNVLSERVSALERELGLDWRYSYSRLHHLSGDRFRLELSREEVIRRLADGVEGFTIGRSGPELLDLCASSGLTVAVRLLGSAGDTVLLVTSSVADLRREPDHAAELLTQAIMGEEVTMLRRQGDWHLVRLRDGYHGWIRSWYLAEVPVGDVTAYRRRADRMVRANVGYILSGPESSSLPVSDVVAGTILAAGESVGAFRRVLLPGGRHGYIREEDLGGPVPRQPDRQRIVATAKRFIGIQYLWGGTSAKGFDCSGLVQRVFRMEGIELPRDSDRQSMQGVLIAKDKLDDAIPGDLLFFGKPEPIDHVAIFLGDGTFIHAYGSVRIGSLDPGDERYEEKLAESLLFARSVIR
ncbi:MAG: C40 family peptidase [bacterium]|nr:MAG: C40 family peptidase [bacterium]